MECYLADSKFAPVITITSQQKVGKRPRVLKGIALQLYSSLLFTPHWLKLSHVAAYKGGWEMQFVAVRPSTRGREEWIMIAVSLIHRFLSWNFLSLDKFLLMPKGQYPSSYRRYYHHNIFELSYLLSYHHRKN